VKLRARLLRIVSGDGGPASKTVLRGIARHRGELDQFAGIFRAMLDAGELVMYGDRKGALYGTPDRPPRRTRA
jgi:hypothetical protein